MGPTPATCVHGPRTPPAPGHDSVTALLQDVDTAFLMKADLETNVEALEQEINFMKGLFEEVPAAMLSSRWLGRGQEGKKASARQVPGAGPQGIADAQGVRLSEVGLCRSQALRSLRKAPGH